MNVTIDDGIATLPDGSTVNLLDVQRLLNDAFSETGEPEYMRNADALVRMTGMEQGPHGEFFYAARDTETKLTDTDYFLDAPSCWIRVKNAALRISDEGTGVKVLVFKDRSEMEDTVAMLIATYENIRNSR